MITRNQTTRPWGLRGREPDIVAMRDERGMTFEQIAVTLGASKQGVIGAYKRGLAALADQTPPEQPPQEDSSATAAQKSTARRAGAA